MQQSLSSFVQARRWLTLLISCFFNISNNVCHQFKGMDEQHFEDALENMLVKFSPFKYSQFCKLRLKLCHALFQALQEDFRKLAEDEKPYIKEKKCVEITIPRKAIMDQRLRTGLCEACRCRRLNVQMVESRLKLRECDPGCGRRPDPKWKCSPCLGRYRTEDMTVYGKGLTTEWRPPCITKAMLEEAERLKQEEAARRRQRSGCGLDVKLIC